MGRRILEATVKRLPGRTMALRLAHPGRHLPRERLFCWRRVAALAPFAAKADILRAAARFIAERRMRKEQPMTRKTVARPILPVRVARLHSRLLISAAVGIAVTLGLAMTDWRMATRLLLGWDIGVVLYLVLIHHLMRSEEHTSELQSPC